SRTSTRSEIALAPSASQRRTVSARSDSSLSSYGSPPMSEQMSETAMSAPSRAKCTACERPWPRAAPVTNTDLPSNRFICSSSPGEAGGRHQHLVVAEHAAAVTLALGVGHVDDVAWDELRDRKSTRLNSSH